MFIEYKGGIIMFSNFSEEAQKVLINSKKEMQELKHPYVGSEHLFLALLKLKNETNKKLSEFGITYSNFKDKLIFKVKGRSFLERPFYNL